MFIQAVACSLGFSYNDPKMSTSYGQYIILPLANTLFLGTKFVVLNGLWCCDEDYNDSPLHVLLIFVCFKHINSTQHGQGDAGMTVIQGF